MDMDQERVSVKAIVLVETIMNNVVESIVLMAFIVITIVFVAISVCRKNEPARKQRVVNRVKQSGGDGEV